MDVESFVWGVVASLVATSILFGVSRYRRVSLKQDIETLEFERTLLEGMKKSSVELNRVSFRSIFAMFMVISLANLIPAISAAIKPGNTFSLEVFELIVWLIAFLGSMGFWKRYDNLKNYKSALERLDKKITTKHEKLER